MTVEELREKIAAAKRFLNHEVVKIRTTGASSVFNFREIGDKLDMIHEVERIGLRNLNDLKFRKVSRMLSQLEEIRESQN